MKKPILLISLITLFSICRAVAQQIPVFTQSQVNPFLLNPAYAGDNNYTSVFVHTRILFPNMPEAPQQYYLTADGILNSKKVGLGMTLHANIEPIIRNMGALLTYRYKIRFAKRHFLSGGLSGGFVQNSLHFDNAVVTDASELAEFYGSRSKLNLDFNAGLLYRFKGLEAGVVVKQLANTPYTYVHSTGEKLFTYRLIRHYEFSAAYYWRFHRYFALKPLFVGQSVQGMPFNFMCNVHVSCVDNYWIGIGYKLQSAYSIMAGLVVSDRLTVGYNCDMAASGYRSQFGLTHEIVIGYHLGRQSSQAHSPYSWIYDTEDEEEW